MKLFEPVISSTNVKEEVVFKDVLVKEAGVLVFLTTAITAFVFLMFRIPTKNPSLKLRLSEASNLTDELIMKEKCLNNNSPVENKSTH